MLLLMAVAIVAVVAVVLVRRRSLRPLLGVRLRWAWLIWAAALVQFVRTRDPHWAGAIVPIAAMWLLGVAFVVVNLRAWPARGQVGGAILAAGFSLNTLVIACNGAMPFSVSAARLAGFPAAAIQAPAHGHAPIGGDTTLAAFADVIPVPGVGVVVSIGDLLMVCGVTVLLSQLALRNLDLPTPQGETHEQVAQDLARRDVHRDRHGRHLRAGRPRQQWSVKEPRAREYIAQGLADRNDDRDRDGRHLRAGGAGHPRSVKEA